ncbi:MAG: 30S ribosomal protein S16 [Bacilli bacterium]|jgi:small subunit ribosomal protein S16|nr:30S ribosomal protein S16 [Bacilli bacterium]
MVKIRLARTGRHSDPCYRIVVADSHYARDGRNIATIGVYDPSKGIDAVEIDEALALQWLRNGAVPSDSVRSMLSAKGILTKFAAEKGKK